MLRGTELCDQEAQGSRALGPRCLHGLLEDGCACPHRAEVPVLELRGSRGAQGLSIINAGLPLGLFQQPWQQQRRGNSSSEMVTGGENRSCLSLWQLALQFWGEIPFLVSLVGG